MRKETGKFIAEFYDELGHKVMHETFGGLLLAKKRAVEWEKKHPNYSVVVYRVLHNTHFKNEKWQYDSNK